MSRTASLLAVGLALTLGPLTTQAQEDNAAAQAQAQAVFAATGVTGGLVVHLGDGEPASAELTAALAKGGACVVQRLDTDPARVEKARKHIRSLGLYGPVSAECWDESFLPYVDHTVNLVVCEHAGRIPDSEILRVLAPGGVAYTKQGDRWTKTVKPPREGVDEWTHFLHDASGNAVAHDTVLAPPRHLQWHAAPRHCRSHEYTPSINALVSSGGRIFYIADQGSRVTLREPAEWKLLARDAYNGLLLWERPIGKWFSHLCGWGQAPRQLQRKLVAVGDRVYVTLGFHAPVSALDAVTGETVKVYPDTEGTEVILWHKGMLLLAVRDVTDARLAEYAMWAELTAQAESPLHMRDTRDPLVKAFRKTENKASVTILALDAATGNVLWKIAGKDARGLRSFSLRACGDRVYCRKKGGLHCLDLKTGKTLWATPSLGVRTVSEEAIVCLSRKEIMVRSPEDGKVRWSRAPTLVSIRDVFLIRGSLWLGGGKPYDTGHKEYTGPVWGPYFAVQHDLATGEVLKEITDENPKHHHRCYGGKATDRYILSNRRGTEFLDLAAGELLWHSWARGTCRYGIMPCNGMLYVPPHACGCYITAKLVGFNALAPARQSRADAGSEVRSQRSEVRGQKSEDRNQKSEVGSQRSDTARLERGPAYGKALRTPNSELHTPGWPTYRCDARRSGRARCAVPAALAPKWQTDAGPAPTAPTVADGKVFMARPDRHELLAIDSASGKTAWTYTTGGRIDSPPTIHEGQVLLGCHDGYVYSLRSADGALAWRFRGARDPRRIVVRGQIESASPAHGSVLVDNGTLCFTAGRSSYLDSGIDLYRLNPATGETLSRTELYSPDPETGRQPKQYGPNSMPGARSDILAADDQYLYLRDLTFSKKGVEVTDRKAHLFTLTDFLDSTWTHRSYWIFGTKSSLSTGCSGRARDLLYGRLLVFDDATVYGYGRDKPHWSNEFEDGGYRVFARKRDAKKPDWSTKVPIRVRAMLLAGDTLFVAGAGPAPSKAPETQGIPPTPLLLALSTADGSEQARCPIDTPPVFDGMAAADGELFLSLENGRLLCMAVKR